MPVLITCGIVGGLLLFALRITGSINPVINDSFVFKGFGVNDRASYAIVLLGHTHDPLLIHFTIDRGEVTINKIIIAPELSRSMPYGKFSESAELLAKKLEQVGLGEEIDLIGYAKIEAIKVFMTALGIETIASIKLTEENIEKDLWIMAENDSLSKAMQREAENYSRGDMILRAPFMLSALRKLHAGGYGALYARDRTLLGRHCLSACETDLSLLITAMRSTQ